MGWLERLSFLPARGAVAGWWSSFSSGLGLLYPDTHLHITPSHFQGTHSTGKDETKRFTGGPSEPALPCCDAGSWSVPGGGSKPLLPSEHPTAKTSSRRGAISQTGRGSPATNPPLLKTSWSGGRQASLFSVLVSGNEKSGLSKRSSCRRALGAWGSCANLQVTTQDLPAALCSQPSLPGRSQGCWCRVQAGWG